MIEKAWAWAMIIEGWLVVRKWIAGGFAVAFSAMAFLFLVPAVQWYFLEPEQQLRQIEDDLIPLPIMARSHIRATIQSGEALLPHGRWYRFDGRIPRSTFWECTIGLFVTGLVLVTLYAFGLPPIIYLLGIAILTYLWLIVNIKRWHDRNKSAWWVLISCIPLVGPIWVLVELGCLAGTDGENRYGKDPRRQYNLMAHHRASPSN